MKRARFLSLGLIASVVVFPLSAEKVTLNWGNGETLTVDTDTGVPSDVIKIITEHKGEIESALTANDVDSTTAESAVTEAKNAYNSYVSSSSMKTTSPYTTAVNGLNDFADIMVDVIPNSQIQQNVWANAWIGYILPKPNFGFGINTGVSKLDLTPLVKVADALGMSDSKDIPETLVWPTVTADLRVGGFFFPFDIGFTAMSIDSNTISAVGNAIDPANFDFFMIGGDIRYAILKGGVLRPKLSVGLGAYYTKGNFGVEQDGSTAELDFDSTSIVLSTQASIKLLFFVPFVGGRLMFTKTNVDWKVHANWQSILGTSSSDIADALKYGILPSNFGDRVSSGFADHVRPVIYGGFAIDMFVVDLTVSGSYDFISEIPSGAVSLRFALN